MRLLARVIGVGIETADMLVQEVLARNMRDDGRRETGTPGASISLPPPYSVFGGMLIARNPLKHAYAVALRVKEWDVLAHARNL